MSTSQASVSESGLGRPMALYSVIVSVLATAIHGGLLGLIAPAVKQDLDADAATMSLISAIPALVLPAFVFGGGAGVVSFWRKRRTTFHFEKENFEQCPH